MADDARTRTRLIAELDRQERVLLGALARDRCAPLLATTLTLQQLRVLLLVHLDGPLGGHDLAERLGVSAPTVSGLLDRLAERGMVVRHEDVEDRRVRKVRLSPAGTQVVEEVLSAGRSRRAALLRRLDPDTLAGLVAGVTALVDVAAALPPEAGGSRAADACRPDGLGTTGS